MLYSKDHTNEVTNQTPFVHLNTFINQFQIRFKTCLQQKYNAETVCHLLCDVTIRIIAVSTTFHSSNQNIFCGTELIVYHLTQTTVRFERLTIVVDDVIVFYHNASEILIVESRAYIRSELLTQWNAGCTTLNNDHYDYTYYERLSAFHVLLLYD